MAAPELDAGGEDGRLAEPGIGTNSAAVLTGNVLEDEKVIGTAHLAFARAPVWEASTWPASISTASCASRRSSSTACASSPTVGCLVDRERDQRTGDRQRHER